MLRMLDGRTLVLLNKAVLPNGMTPTKPAGDFTKAACSSNVNMRSLHGKGYEIGAKGVRIWVMISSLYFVLDTVAKLGIEAMSYRTAHTQSAPLLAQ